MIRRRIVYAVWLLLAACLYFFENGTGTRAVLLCSALIPFIPLLRRAFLSPDEAAEDETRDFMTVRTFVRREPDEPGDIRPYVPGDPIRRIHWKLSAKKDELLVRGAASAPETAEEEERKVSPEHGKRGSRFPAAAAAGILLCGLLLLLVPEANRGAQVLCNRLFTASEAVNAYAYRRFPVPEDQSAVPAAVLLLCAAILLLALAATHPRRLPALGIMAGCALFQVYFGLAFPAWVCIPLYGLPALRMLRRPADRRSVLGYCAMVLLVSLLTALFLPGVNAATEAASESIRDRLAQITEQLTGAVQEIPDGETEARRIHTRSMETGDREAGTEREFRLETVEEEQISMPGWINWMKVILLLILTVAVLVLPFVPFILLDARRKKARDIRKTFESPDVREAFQAIFRRIILWLEATKQGAGNRLYRDWAGVLPEGYADRFSLCAADYEESVYSDHAMREEQRQNALALLKETETVLWKAADRKQRLYLKYWMCLHE